MELNTLTAVSPIDGRYHKQVAELSDFFSEYALIRYRVMVETEYFLSLAAIPLPQLKKVTSKQKIAVREMAASFMIGDAEKVKEIEKITNHDVKAVEYYLRGKFDDEGLTAYKEFVHFGLTSQDINNTALPLLLRDAFTLSLQPELENNLKVLRKMSSDWKDLPMLARTHGQPASPTCLGKEIFVFVERIEQQLYGLDQIPFYAKFGGASGNLNAHFAAYPGINWVAFANEFILSLGLERQQATTQIEHYDQLAAFFDGLKRICTIFIDLCRDMWLYISMDYFGQKIKKGEVGSSAMPHKVNPIDFENAEGNLGMAIAIFEHLSAKLPVSRLQRDLTDSTVTRNIGVPIGHMLIAMKSIAKGLGKLVLNEGVIKNDLDANWAVIAEALQTILRREQYPEPYEVLKNLTRTGKRITRELLHEFIDGLGVSQTVKKELKAITPFNYIGSAPF